MSKMINPTKVITGKDTRWSYCNAWEPKSINGGTPKYSVSLIIPKKDTVTISKIKAAHYALEGTGCALIARTDSYHILGKDEAVSRCNDAIDAGADISFVEGAGSLADIEEMGKTVKGYKMFAMASAGASPKVTVDQLSKWGYSLMTMHFAMAGQIMGTQEYAKKCFEAMSDIPVTEDPRVDSSPIYLFELFGLHNWLQLGNRFNPEIKDATEWDKKDE